MSDSTDQNPRDPNRPLSEIGHLFLSSIRDRQTGGSPRPMRKGPQKTAASVDLTPEEYAKVYGQASAESSDNSPRKPEVTVVLAAHLNSRQSDRAREYAAHLSATHGRIGLIELEESEFRLSLFERKLDGESIESESVSASPEKMDPRRIQESLSELAWDVDRWLLLIPNLRGRQTQALLTQANHWTLLATCDYDGMVSAYRTLKGLLGSKPATVPSISLALMDVCSLDEADRVTLKLTGVVQQFLRGKLDSEAVVKPASQTAEHLVLSCRKSRESSGLPHFDAVSAFMEKTAEPISAPVVAPVFETSDRPEFEKAIVAEPVEEIAMPVIAPIVSEPVAGEPSEVLELVGDDANPQAVIGAFVRGRSGLAETPVKAPNCPTATLTVGRDRKLVLVAVARQGLNDLRDIATAYRWLTDNRPLIAMALPQFAIEPTHAPKLQLLIDQTDLRAEMLQPLLKSENVNVQTYRKLRWGGKTGLLLEAA